MTSSYELAGSLNILHVPSVPLVVPLEPLFEGQPVKLRRHAWSERSAVLVVDQDQVMSFRSTAIGHGVLRQLIETYPRRTAVAYVANPLILVT